MIDVLYLAYKDVVKQRKLLAIVFIALTIGMCNTAITTGVMKGFEKYVTEDLVDVLGAHIIILPAQGNEYFKNAQSIIDKAESIPDVKTVIVRSYFLTSVQVIGKQMTPESRNSMIEVDAVDPDKESDDAGIAQNIIAGKWLDGEPGEIVAGKIFADLRGLEVGDLIEVNFRNKGIKKIFKVKGIVEAGFEGIDINLFMNLEDSYEIMGGPGRYNYLSIKLYDKDKSDAVKSALMSEGISETIMTWDESLSFAKNILDMFTLVLFVVSSIAIFTAALSVAILMYINVLHKTKTIGTLKAIGASNNKIIMLFLTESIIIAIFGIIFASLIAAGLVMLLSQNPIDISAATIRFYLDTDSLVKSILAAFVAIVVSGIYPAYMASKLEVIEAMRYE